MADVDYKGSYKGIGEMLRAPFMIAEMRRRAYKVRAAAVADAPVGEDSPHPGRYKRGFRVEAGVRVGKTRRAVGRVINDAPEAIYVEFGTKRTKRHRTLGRALNAAKG